MVFTHSFTTRLGVSGMNVETTVESFDGKVKRHFKQGQPVRLQVSDILAMVGVDLDSRNSNSGGQEPLEGQYWPIYRMTGKNTNKYSEDIIYLATVSLPTGIAIPLVRKLLIVS